MLDIMYIYMYIYINIYVYFEGLDKNRVMLTSFARARMVGATRSQPNVSNSAAWLAVSPEIGPQFPEHGAGNRAPISGKTPQPEIGAQFGRSWGESSLQPFGCKLVRLQLGQIQAASTAIHLHLVHGHRPRSRPNQIQNPKSKLQTARWILDFGFWISDFGFWILDFGFGFWISDFGFWILDSDFGFGILDQFSLRSFCGGPKRPRLILDFGFRILDFGFWAWIRITTHRLDPA